MSVMSTRKITVAPIGAGFIGELHARNLARHPDITLTFVVEPHETPGRRVAQGANATWLPEPDAAFDDGAVERRARFMRPRAAISKATSTPIASTTPPPRP